MFGTSGGPVGKVEIELFKDVVPRTVENFVQLLKRGRGKGYKGCKLHRIIPGFMIQGGDFELENGAGGSSIYGRYFEDENFELRHDGPGILSMANAGPNTNGSQFFITLDYTPHLDGKHVVFGRVTKGLEVLNKVARYGSESGETKETVRIIDCGSI